MMIVLIVVCFVLLIAAVDIFFGMDNHCPSGRE